MDTRKPFAGLIPAVIFVFVFGSMAMASDIAFYVGAVPGGLARPLAPTLPQESKRWLINI